jgi:predicted Kef-type K+ transport protein
VTPDRIVEHFDVVKDILSCLFSVPVGLALDPLALGQLEKTFSDSVIIAVASTAYAAHKVVLLQKGLPVATGVLATLIRMNDYLVLWLTAPHSHQ